MRGAAASAAGAWPGVFDSTAPQRLVVRVFGSLLWIGVFFPFVTPVETGTDTQPYALMAAIVVTAAAWHRRVPRELLLLMVPFAAAILVLMASGVHFTGIRATANYGSLALISLAACVSLSGGRDRFRLLLEAAVWVWLAAAVLQVVAGREVLGFLLPSVRTSATRGVTGLAPEPTHYGFQGVFMLLLVLMEFRGRRRLVLGAALIVQIVVIARSTMASLFLLLMLGAYFVVNLGSAKRILVAVSAATLLVATGVLLARFNVGGLGDSRLFYLIGLLVENPQYLFLVDRSGNQRMADILFSFSGFLDSHMIPNGFDAYEGYVERMAWRFRAWVPNPNPQARIMSGYGAALFELGAVGLIVPLVVTLAMWRRLRHDGKRFLVLTGTIHLMLLTAIPLATPIVAGIIGYAASGAPAAERVTNPGRRGSLSSGENG